ncbi:glutamate mutase L [Aromatoleum evansii]|uniref:Glutamate mutase L n=1 Tax=Aromatoleum evansii TaxID=59406 RepID=A0ABZ1AGR6_AROEV|nr:glutamate mutase L [Aromatoleum evansii]
MIYATIDIGSTWTKGASFRLVGDRVQLERRAARPTTVVNLSEAFFAVLGEIVAGDPLDQLRRGELRLRYSSSAKGGLAVAAIGLVPDVTLEIGKLAAQSAGARLSQVFAYRLTARDLAQLEERQPDIVLLAGGTDGGNSDYVLANAATLANSRLDCDIIYAGNREVADEVAALLAGKRLKVVPNLLPDFNEPNPDPARDAIRTIFLDAIVKGKGLDAIMDATGSEPVPTPFAVLEYARAIRDLVPGWSEFLLLDMGGATTDVYSAHRETPISGTIRRGFPEPDVKRTVEGDLGMRVSAQAVCEIGGTALAAALDVSGVSKAELAGYAARVTARPDSIPTAAEDRHLDTLLAGLCVGHAVARHVGRTSPVYTPDGEVMVQTGRDLSSLPKVVGSGGWLAKAEDFSPAAWFAGHRFDQRGRTVLAPRNFAYYRDADYLFPLLANLARDIPAAAARAGIDFLIAQETRNEHAIA